MDAFNEVKELIRKMVCASEEAAKRWEESLAWCKCHGWPTVPISSPGANPAETLNFRHENGEDSPAFPPAESLCDMATRWVGAHRGTCISNSFYERLMFVPGADRAIEKLRQWAAENPPAPVRTYRDDFFEKFPEARRDGGGLPRVCRANVYGGRDGCLEAGTACKTCWDAPLGYWEKEKEDADEM